MTPVESELAAGPGLGPHVRALRKARGLTLVTLAEASGLSHPFLSQVERGLANLSLGSLRRIAVALETSPVELIAAAEGALDADLPLIEITRSGDGAATPSSFAQGSAKSLATGHRPFLPIVVTADDAGHDERFVHAEDEFLLVMRGAIHLELDGEVHALAEGDSAYFAGGVTHKWSADGPNVQVLIVKQQAGA